MKCDELKSVYIDRTGDWVRSGNDTGKFYLKEEVDSVINDLQKTNVMLADNAVKLNRELDKLKVEHHKERHEYIKMIAELKEKLEDAKASHYAEMVDAGMENRRLKRALWLARARNARNMKAYENLDNYTSNHQSRNSRWNYISSQRYDCWFYAWEKVERKCLKKAEEYK